MPSPELEQNARIQAALRATEGLSQEALEKLAETGGVPALMSKLKNVSEGLAATRNTLNSALPRVEKLMEFVQGYVSDKKEDFAAKQERLNPWERRELVTLDIYPRQMAQALKNSRAAPSLVPSPLALINGTVASPDPEPTPDSEVPARTRRHRPG